MTVQKILDVAKICVHHIEFLLILIQVQICERFAVRFIFANVIFDSMMNSFCLYY